MVLRQELSQSGTGLGGDYESLQPADPIVPGFAGAHQTIWRREPLIQCFVNAKVRLERVRSVETST